MPSAISYGAPRGPPRWSRHLPLARASPKGTTCMACTWEGCPGCFPSHPSASETPRQGNPEGCLLCVLLCVVPEERLPVGVRIHYDAQYTVDLSSVPDPASHASCTPAGPRRAQHVRLYPMAPGWVGRRLSVRKKPPSGVHPAPWYPKQVACEVFAFYMLNIIQSASSRYPIPPWPPSAAGADCRRQKPALADPWTWCGTWATRPIRFPAPCVPEGLRSSAEWPPRLQSAVPNIRAPGHSLRVGHLPSPGPA